MLKRAEGWARYAKKDPILAKRATKPGKIRTLEGTMSYRKGDMIAKGVDGEKWPIRKEVFAKSHRKVAGATSLLARAHGFAKEAGRIEDIWKGLLRGHLKPDGKFLDDWKKSQAVQELMEPMRDFATWAKTPAGKRGLAAGAGVALMAGAGVVYLDKLQDRSLLPA